MKSWMRRGGSCGIAMIARFVCVVLFLDLINTFFIEYDFSGLFAFSYILTNFLSRICDNL